MEARDLDTSPELRDVEPSRERNGLRRPHLELVSPRYRLSVRATASGKSTARPKGRDPGGRQNGDIMQNRDFPPPRVLSVRQPHAAAFFYADPPKDIENRGWRASYTGALFIHAAIREDPHWRRSPMADVLAALPVAALAVRGAIIGMCELTSYTRDSSSPWAVPGLWHWQIEAIFPMLEIAERGRLSLWVPESAWLRPGEVTSS